MCADSITTIACDLGHVLIDQDPYRTLPQLNQTPQFLDTLAQTIGFPWADECDLGTAKECIGRKKLQHPEHADFIQGYYDLWPETVGPVHEDTVEVIYQLKEKGFRLIAASNWSSDMFERVRHKMTFLPVFEGFHISGYIGVQKPKVAYFRLAMEVFGFSKDEAILLDDKKRNCRGANRAGWDSIQHISTMNTYLEFQQRLML